MQRRSLGCWAGRRRGAAGGRGSLYGVDARRGGCRDRRDQARCRRATRIRRRLGECRSTRHHRTACRGSGGHLSSLSLLPLASPGFERCRARKTLEAWLDSVGHVTRHVLRPNHRTKDVERHVGVFRESATAECHPQGAGIWRVSAPARNRIGAGYEGGGTAGGRLRAAQTAEQQQKGSTHQSGTAHTACPAQNEPRHRTERARREAGPSSLSLLGQEMLRRCGTARAWQVASVAFRSMRFRWLSGLERLHGDAELSYQPATAAEWRSAVAWGGTTEQRR